MVGDHVIIVIPADHKNDTKYSILQRSQFRNRFVNVVGTLVHEGTTAYRGSDLSHRKEAENHASTHHGIERNQKEYLDIRCSIEWYPNRDNYLQDVLPLNELTRKNFMSMDDFCEKQNYALKQCMNHANIEMMCKRSRHLHASSRCAKMIFGYEGKSDHHDIDITDDVRGLYQFFAKCHVFDAPEANVALNSTTFSKEAVPLTFINSKQRKKIDDQRQKAFTSRDKGLLSSFQGSENLITRDPNDESNDDDSDNGRDIARSREEFVDVEVSSLDGNGSVDWGGGDTNSYFEEEKDK